MRSNVRLKKQTSPMPEYADIYAVSEERTEQAITRFLDCFLPSRIESADEYEIPQYAEAPTTVFTEVADLIRHCCSNRSEVHTIYWRSDSQSEHAMVFFLRDGGLIVGISTPADDARRVDEVACELERFLGSQEVIVTYENLPPDSTEDFRSLFHNLSPRPDETARRSRAHRPIKGERTGAPNP